MIEHLTRRAKEANRRGNVSIESQSENSIVIKVGNEKISIKKRNGGNLFLCTCDNHSIKSGHSTICWHKLAAMDFLTNSFFDKFLGKLLSEYEKTTELNLKSYSVVFLEDLKKLKNARFSEVI